MNAFLNTITWQASIIRVCALVALAVVMAMWVG
jgi:hypothetical protein